MSSNVMKFAMVPFEWQNALSEWQCPSFLPFISSHNVLLAAQVDSNHLLTHYHTSWKDYAKGKG